MLGSVLAASTVAVGVNTVATVSAKKDPFPTLMAGGLLTTALVLINEWEPGLASGLAMLFLVATLLTRGAPFFNFMSALVTPKAG